MSGSLKKLSAGFYFSLATIVIALIALFVYVRNGNGAYYNDFSAKIVILTVAAIVAEIVLIISARLIGERRWLDVVYLIAPILLGLSAVAFISIRVESAGIILGSDLEKGNVAASNALSQAFIGTGLYLVAMTTGVTRSFLGQQKP
jgi:chromate transport protein ChrA